MFWRGTFRNSLLVVAGVIRRSVVILLRSEGAVSFFLGMFLVHSVSNEVEILVSLDAMGCYK